MMNMKANGDEKRASHQTENEMSLNLMKHPGNKTVEQGISDGNLTLLNDASSGAVSATDVGPVSGQSAQPGKPDAANEAPAANPQPPESRTTRSKSSRQVEIMKRRADGTDGANDKAAEGTNIVNKNGILIFKKSSPHYITFIQMCERKGWTEKLPSAKTDPDLAAFLEKTGFSRAQVARKFGEYQRSLWLGDKLNGQGDGQVGKRVVSESKLKPKKKKQKTSNSSYPISKITPMQDTLDGTVAFEEPLVAALPPLRLSDLGLHLQRQSNDRTSADANDLYAPLPTSPVKRTQSTLSEVSPLRTRKFHDISPTASGNIRLERDHSWSMEQLLKGSVMSEPSNQTQFWPQDQFSCANTGINGSNNTNNHVNSGFLSPFNSNNELFGQEPPSLKSFFSLGGTPNFFPGDNYQFNQPSEPSCYSPFIFQNQNNASNEMGDHHINDNNPDFFRGWQQPSATTGSSTEMMRQPSTTTGSSTEMMRHGASSYNDNNNNARSDDISHNNGNVFK